MLSRENLWGIGLMLIGAALAVFVGKALGVVCGVVGLALIVWAQFHEDGTPSVVPVRYGSAPTSPRQINGVWCKADGTPFSMEEVLRAKHMLGYQGLLVANDGDPAYEIYVLSGKIGDSTPTFENKIQRLTKNDGEGFFPINIKLAGGGGLLGGLSEEMRTKNIATLPITICYRSGKRRRYKTTCKIARDVSAIHGLSIEDVHHGRDWFGFLRIRAKDNHSQ